MVWKALILGTQAPQRLDQGLSIERSVILRGAGRLAVSDCVPGAPAKRRAARDVSMGEWFAAAGEGPGLCARPGTARTLGRDDDDDLHPCLESRWAWRRESPRPARGGQAVRVIRSHVRSGCNEMTMEDVGCKQLRPPKIRTTSSKGAASPNRSNWRGSPVHFVRTNRVTR